MPTTSRIVTGHFERGDSTPWSDSPMSYRLSQWSYMAGAIVPGQTIDDATDSNGDSATVLWCNTEGFRPSVWIVTKPSGEQKAFVLPVGTTPISLDEIFALGGVIDWDEGSIIPWLETWTAAIYAAFASAADPVLGDFLVGTRNTGTGALATTVHAKLGRIMLTSDYDSLENAAAAADAAGLTLVVNTDETLNGSLITPATLAIAAVPAGRIEVPDDMTLTILGPFIAERHHVFMFPGEGTGTVDLNSAKIEGVYPEWFGIDPGATDHTAAFQRACDAHLVVIGDASTQYRLQTDAYQFTPLNLHRIKHPDNDPNNGWKYGIWYAVRLRDGQIVTKCRILATRVSNPNGTDPGTGVITKTGKGTFIFACGNPTYGWTMPNPPAPAGADITSRVSRVTVTDNEFMHFDFPTKPDGSPADELYPGGPRAYMPGERYKCVVTISCDAPVFTNNRLISHYTRNNILGAYVFDCRGTAVFDDNYGERVFSGLVGEYVGSVSVQRNTYRNSRQFVDCDAFVNHGIVIGNLSDRDTRDTGTDDSVYEFNGIKNLVMSGNVTRRGHRGIVINNKPHLYETWEGVMAQSGPVSTCMWENCTLDGTNIWRELSWQGFLGGSNWNTFPHMGQMIGNGLTILDEFTDCGMLLDSGEDHAVVQLYEGRGLDIRPRISNPAQHLTTVAAPVTGFDGVAPEPPAVTTLTLTSVAGFAVNDHISIQYNGPVGLPPVNPPRKHQVSSIVSIAGNVVTLDPGLVWNVAVGNSVRGGSGGGLGTYVRSYVEGDGVAAKDGLCYEAAAAEAEQIKAKDDPAHPGSTFVKFSSVIIQTDDPDIEDWVTQLTDVTTKDVSGTTVYTLSLAEPLPASVSVGNTIVQEAATGAGASSALTGTIGGTYHNQGFAAIRIGKPGTILVDHPLIRECGRHAAPGNRAQVWLTDLQAEYTRKGVAGSVIIDGADIESTTGDVRYGVLVQAGALDAVTPNGWAAGLWGLSIHDSRTKGHTHGGLFLLDSGEGTENQSLVNVSLLDNSIESTNINTTPITSVAGIRMSAAGPPVGAGVPNVRSRVGTILINSNPTPGAPFAWICTAEGRPGTWYPVGTIGGTDSGKLLGTKDWNVAIPNNSYEDTVVTVTGAREGWHTSASIIGLVGDFHINSRVVSDNNVIVAAFNRSGIAHPVGTTLKVYVEAWPFVP